VAIVVERPSSPALLRRTAEIAEALKPRSRAMTRFREDLRLLVVEDHYHMLLENKDRYGRQRAPLAASTLANPKRGPGPSLIPNYYRSRFIANFEALWEVREGLQTLVARYRDILSKAGKPFAQYHATGAHKAGTNWYLPRRDTGGITPTGWVKVKRLFAILPEYLLRQRSS
jgi:hypothetical protein